MTSKHLLKLKIKAYNDHFWVSGFGDSGKSALIKYGLIPLLMQKLVLAIYDYNHNYGNLGVPVTNNIKIVAKFLMQRKSIVYQAPINTLEGFELFCKLCARIKNVVVVMEEFQEFVKPNHMADGISAVIRTGRNSHLSYVVVTQRPQEVPKAALNNAKHRFYFKQDVDSEADRKWLEHAIGSQMAEKLMAAADYSYVYKLRSEHAILCPPIEIPKSEAA